MKQNNLKIAITGGIGSGKSTVAEFITEEGYTVISCDEIYRQLLLDKNLLNKLTDTFGNILTENGTLDRKKLSEIVFSDKIKLKKLNEITHRAIMDEALKKMSGQGLFFCEVPLLFEGGFENLFDDVIVVMRDKEHRVSSVVQRDKLDENSVNERINSQFNYENLQFEKYYVIHNNSDLDNLHTQTLEIIEKIIAK